MLSEDDLNQLRDTHGRIAHCVYNGIDLVFRKPTRVEIQMFRSATGEERDEELARKIIVHPPREAFATLIADYPMLVNNAKVVRAMGIATGVVEETEAKN